MTTKRDPQTLLPLTPAMFYVLMALADGQTHGYAILKDVEELTNGSVRLSTGTLYGIMKRLLADGLIRKSGASAKDDERRRSYELTTFGRDAPRRDLSDREAQGAVPSKLKPRIV
jgi:DNA-binding PadR family transcriptional regulator